MNIYLMKGGTHYVLDQYLTAQGFQFSFLKEDSAQSYYQDELMIRAFERVSVTATIGPAYIGVVCVSTNYCFQTGEQVSLVWKSHLASFWISKSLTISNVIIDGSDMFSFQTQSDNTMGSNGRSTYFKKKEQCCVCDSEGVCSTLISNSDCFCGTRSQTIPNPIGSQEYVGYNLQTYSLYRWHKRAYGIFNLEFLSDYSSATIPKLIIQVFDYYYYYYYIVLFKYILELHI